MTGSCDSVSAVNLMSEMSAVKSEPTMMPDKIIMPMEERPLPEPAR